MVKKLPKNQYGNIKNYDPLADLPDYDPGGFGYDADNAYGNTKRPYIGDGVFTGGRARKSAVDWIEENPEAYYQAAQGNLGNPTDETTEYGRWVQDQYANLYDDYVSAQTVSPNLTWNKFLAGVMPQQENEYRTRSASARGAAPVVVGGAQWLSY